MKILKKGDIIIIVTIILISILPLFIFKTKKVENAKIIVTQDSQVIGIYDLNNTKKAKYIDFYFEMSGKKYKATLETKNSKVRLLRLPKQAIPKSIHADMGYIENDSKIIVALPAKLVVSIQSEKEKENEEIDTIST